ncbi:uncharacterized protein [Venturia canescens]|uniref:uncharacterized protein n=1 Tax=Venturia canescens TaxID=32260 RepID=UPI001C9CF469|nr:uncharacterized protein LOC122416593 [Venturia canescens]
MESTTAEMNLRVPIGYYIFNVYFGFFARSVILGEREWVPNHDGGPKDQVTGIEHHGEILEALALKLDQSVNRADERILFYLYTKHNPKDPQVLKFNSLESFRTSWFEGDHSTVFITHGFLNTANSEAVTSVRDAYLNGTEELNVITVDWSAYSISFYSSACGKVESIGSDIARMINFMKSYTELKLYLTTLVGHSLGAHIMGVAGREVTGGKVNQIFALDPAGPGFEGKNSSSQLSPRDARNVQVIHTCGNALGYRGRLGDADFYPNGGLSQPGCALGDSIFNGACSHGRSFWYFAESLNSPTGFQAIKCRSGENPHKGQCRGKARLMGGRSNTINVTGVSYLKTHDTPPYAVLLQPNKLRTMKMSIVCFIPCIYSAIFGQTFDLPRTSIYVIDRNNNSNNHRYDWIPDRGPRPEELSMTLQQTDGVVQALALTGQHHDKRSTSQVLFHLYTKKNPTDGQELKIGSLKSVRNSFFQSTKRTVFITHGFFITASFSPVTSIRDEYLKSTEEVNVIAVDWSPLAISLYNIAAINVVTAGIEIARMIDFLRKQAKLKLFATTLVGHSLGAHVVGVAGRRVTGGKVSRIFGLDPALPYFSEKNATGRLSRSSARNVQVIHTNGGQLGLLEPLGHADFYVNGGASQPGCTVLDSFFAGSCSHGRAFWLFAESINSPVGFKSIKCRPRDNYYKGPSGGSQVALMGGVWKRHPPVGIYYLQTSDTAPFALRMRRKRNRKCTGMRRTK